MDYGQLGSLSVLDPTLWPGDSLLDWTFVSIVSGEFEARDCLPRALVGGTQISTHRASGTACFTEA